MVENSNSSKQVPSLSNVYVVQSKPEECENKSSCDFKDIETELDVFNAPHEDFDLDHLNLAYLNLDSE